MQTELHQQSYKQGGSTMGISGVNAKNMVYANQELAAPNTTGSATETETEKKDPAASEGAVYDKTPAENEQKPTYKVNKMSAEDRAALVKKLKSEQENRQNQLLDIVNKMISKQATTYKQADDNFWKLFTQKSIQIDPEYKDFADVQAKAKADIAEDGYYGVNNTAQRIFDFASALAGDDVDKMKEMQEAFTKGFKQAEKLWGEGKLPKISYDTQDAVNKMFDDYYKSKETITEESV